MVTAAQTAAASGSGGAIATAAAARVQVDASEGSDDVLSISHHLQFPGPVSFVHGTELITAASHPVVSHGCKIPQV